MDAGLNDRLEISPRRYAQVALVALAALSLVVLTGAAVRLTGSGLGCPDWPKCYGGTVPPLDAHAVIEYANRVFTGSGPHAGAHAGQLVRRFTFEGNNTLEWIVQRHAAIATAFGIAAIAVWLLLRRPGGDRRAVGPLTAVLALIALQGLVGGVQWALELPGELVWVHVALATMTWLAMLWAVAAAGRLAPQDEL